MSVHSAKRSVNPLLQRYSIHRGQKFIRKSRFFLSTSKLASTPKFPIISRQIVLKPNKEHNQNEHANNSKLHTFEKQLLSNFICIKLAFYGFTSENDRIKDEFKALALRSIGYCGIWSVFIILFRNFRLLFANIWCPCYYFQFKLVITRSKSFSYSKFPIKKIETASKSLFQHFVWRKFGTTLATSFETWN